MKYLLLSIFSLFIFIISTQAQETESTTEETSTFPIDISGSVDAYFRTNFTTSNYDEGQNVIAPVSSFANLPGFSLGMVNLIASKEVGKVGFVADLVLGPRGQDAVFASSGSPNIVNQLYMTYAPSETVTFTFGNFNTYLGYEVISPTANFNYSTSYMFSYGPFSHSGLKADFDLGGGTSLALALMNPTDFTDFDPFGSIVFGAQLGFESDNGGTWINLRYGDEDGTLKDDKPFFTASSGALFQADITTGYDVSENLYAGFNATFLSVAAGELRLDNGTIQDADGDASGFFGAAVYLQYATSDMFKIGGRIEYFGENNGLGIIPTDVDGDGSMIDFTLSGNIMLDNLTLIPEIRFDISSEDNAFPNSDFGDNEDSSSLGSFVLAAVYGF